jgi:hypothetical protein
MSLAVVCDEPSIINHTEDAVNKGFSVESVQATGGPGIIVSATSMPEGISDFTDGSEAVVSVECFRQAVKRIIRQTDIIILRRIIMVYRFILKISIVQEI